MCSKKTLQREKKERLDKTWWEKSMKKTQEDAQQGYKRKGTEKTKGNIYNPM